MSVTLEDLHGKLHRVESQSQAPCKVGGDGEKKEQLLPLEAPCQFSYGPIDHMHV